jgi:hypothetical protein
MENIIEQLKTLRIGMATKGDTIMHIAAIFDKKMRCFLQRGYQ